ncbi:hypothetical protein [Streptomyces sp. B8F3]|uniref:hypothetical protein n=1 Tax=unclassified Streptomyces TaxID=2593676 RepID=UPI00325F672D
MTRPRRVPDAATRRVRLLGYVLVLLGLLAGAASCADAGRSGPAASHGLVLRAAAPQSDVLDALRLDASPADRHQSDVPPGDALRAEAAPGNGLPAGAPSADPRTPHAPAPAAAPLPLDCSSVHAPGAPAGDCPAASEREPAAPLSGPGFCPAPGDGLSYVPCATAVAEHGVSPAPPSALGTPDLHELQVQRT